MVNFLPRKVVMSKIIRNFAGKKEVLEIKYVEDVTKNN